MDSSKNSLIFCMFSLVASSGTLICCALPILLVSIGFGSAVVALNSELPLLANLTNYKGWLFLISGTLLLLAAWQLHSTRNLCPADPKLAKSCMRIKNFSKNILIVALIFWAIGFIAAYIALPVRVWLDT